MPSTVTWRGGTSGDWDTASNWSTGRLPGAGDDVVINTANATITHTGSNLETIHSLSTAATDTLNWSNGTLNIVSASTLNGTIDLSGGTWEGGGNLTLTGTLNWSGYATMSGTGTTTLNTGATLNLGGDNNGDYQTLDGRTFNNKSTANWLANSYALNMDDGAVFDNESGATFTANTPRGNSSSTQHITNNLGQAGTFINAGTFTNAAGTGNTTEFDYTQFNNTGTVNANTGTLWLDGGNESAGTFFIPVSGTLDFGGGVTTLHSSIGTSTTKATGTLAFSGGTTTVTGAINDTGNFAIDINGGTADFENKTDSLPYLNLTAGTLTGSAAVTVTATTGTALTWSGFNSTMSGVGSTTLASNATMNLGGGYNQVLFTRTFNNLGTTNWLNGSGGMEMEWGAIFNNEANATFNANTNQGFFPGPGATGAFNNAGTFNNNPGTGNTTSFSAVLFNNSGKVNVNTGTLLLYGGGNDSKGNFFVPSAGTLQFGFGAANVYTTLASAIGSSTNKAAGTLAFASGTTVFTGALYDTGTFTVDITNSFVDFERNVSIPYLNLTGAGNLTGSAAVTVTATAGTALTWNGSSTMSGVGSTTLASGATMNLGGSGPGQTLDARTFNNAKGKVNWLTGSSALYMNDGAVFNNELGATFTANVPNGTSQVINNNGGYAGTFINAGTFNNNPGAGNTTLFNYALFNNTGTVNVNTGTLVLGDGGNDTKGTFFVPAGATLEFDSGVTNLASAIGSTSNKAAGTLIFSAGTTTVTGAITDTGSFTVDINGGATVDFENTTDSFPYLNLSGYPTTLTGSAAITVTATSGTALTWNGSSTMSGTGSTTLVSGATMSLGGNDDSAFLDTRTFNNQGTTNWLPGASAFYLANGAIFNNTGTFIANTPYSLLQAQSIANHNGAEGTFVNAGTFKTAAGSGKATSFYNTAFHNTGTVNVTSGTLQFSYGGVTSSGLYTVASGADLAFNGGINNLNSASTSVTGAGNVTFTTGEADFAGTYNITGGTSISSGTVNFYNGGSTGTFANTGGTVGLASGTTFTVNNGNYVQSGGSTYLNGGTLAVTGGGKDVDIEQNTYLYGPGFITGNLSNEGNVYVGGGQSLTGALSVSGNYIQSSTGTLYVNIGGPTAGTQYDQLNVGGAATLAGTLDVTLVNGYSPSLGTQFDILTYSSETGDFATKNLDGLSSASPGPTAYLVDA